MLPFNKRSCNNISYYLFFWFIVFVLEGTNMIHTQVNGNKMPKTAGTFLWEE